MSAPPPGAPGHHQPARQLRLSGPCPPRRNAARRLHPARRGAEGRGGPRRRDGGAAGPAGDRPLCPSPPPVSWPRRRALRQHPRGGTLPRPGFEGLPRKQPRGVLGSVEGGPPDGRYGSGRRPAGEARLRRDVAGRAALLLSRARCRRPRLRPQAPPRLRLLPLPPPPRCGRRLRGDRGGHVPGVSGPSRDGRRPAVRHPRHLRVHRRGGAVRAHRHRLVQRRGGTAGRLLRRGRAPRVRAGPVHGGRRAGPRQRRPRPSRRAGASTSWAGCWTTRGSARPSRWPSTSSSSTSTTTGARIPKPSTASGSPRPACAASSASRSAKATAS